MAGILVTKMRVMLVMGLLAGPLEGRAGEWNKLLNYTGFAGDKLDGLRRGEVLGKRATLTRMPNAMAVELCFLTPNSLEQTGLALFEWDPSRVPDLGVRLHQSVQNSPRPGDFSNLSLNAQLAPDRVTLERCASLAAGSFVQLVSRDELGLFAKYGQDPAAAWREVLLGRAKRYVASGLKEMPAYDGFSPPFKLQAGWQQLVSLTPEVTRRFIDVLQIALNEPQRRTERSFHKLYWEMLTIQGETTFLLGAIHQMANGESIRTADLQYYVSSHFTSALILHEMWPVDLEGKPATLVWRGDFVLLPEAVTSQGIERMASENLLLQEVKRAATAFLKSLR